MALAAATNPNFSPQIRAVAMAIYQKEVERSQPQPMSIQRMEDGTLLGVDPRSGSTRVLYQGAGKDTRTTEQKNYELAKSQGFTGTFQEYQTQLKRAGATTVDARQMGTIPPGFQLKQGPDGTQSMEPIPGSPAARDAAKAEQQQAAGADQKKVGANFVIQDIDRALKMVGESWTPVTGFWGNLLSKAPGSNASDVSKLLDTVKSAASFGTLQAMREASPTGGALGSVTENELKLLQSTLGSLEQSQSEGQFRDNLKRVKNNFMDIIHGRGKGPPREELSFEADGKKAAKPNIPPAPPGIDPEDWKYMTPEERARWK
jgi:hypothetical protein